MFLGSVLTTPIVSTQTHTVIGSISGGTQAIAFTPDGSRAYLGSGFIVRVLNTATNAIVATIPFTNANGATAAMVMSPPTRIMSLSGNLGFGGVYVGTAASATLTIGNSGNSPLIVTSLGFPAGFSGNWAGGIIPPGGSQPVTVTFAPTSPRIFSGTLTVNANQTSGASTMQLSGYGRVELAPVADFDGDRRSDVAVFRPSNGTWYIRNSGTGLNQGLVWGGTGDVPVTGDYDGDALADMAVFRPSNGTWYVRNSSTGLLTTVVWGGASDVPVPGDYDADGRTDIAVFRPSDGVWYVRNSSTGLDEGLLWPGGRPMALLWRRSGAAWGTYPWPGTTTTTVELTSRCSVHRTGDGTSAIRVRGSMRGCCGAGWAMCLCPAITTRMARPTWRCSGRPQALGTFAARLTVR